VQEIQAVQETLTAVPESGSNRAGNTPRQVSCTVGFVIVLGTLSTFVFYYVE
jgi:hypothetical protein